MTKIKICGITNEVDALFCAECGADFLGFIFVPGSPRFVEPEKAGKIVARLRESGHASRIAGVFRDASNDYIREIKDVAGLDLVQLHGSETDDDIRELAIPAIKTLHVGDSLPDTHATPTAAWLLFDTYDERRAGGTGRRFDWSLMATYERSKPFFLSGGLNPDNVVAAISLVRPDAVDIASGVEARPGIKDHAAVARLFERVRRP
ncbi:MAG TPA: phosphoribosylanthranilate isomerase [Thermoanaerobaculia bacterium]|jgi:phosphoribosylanthranilate isomerase|nr:phosphoribosylanthranilate isomerase [Thermoanaerobaculia bacterium]